MISAPTTPQLNLPLAKLSSAANTLMEDVYSLTATDFFHISSPTDTYIYDIIPVSSGLVAISSDDTLRLLDPNALNGGGSQLKAGKGITCFKAVDEENLVAVAQRDGVARVWDIRAGNSVAEVSAEDNAAILSLATYSPCGLAAGTELKNHQASVLIWDLRKPGTPMTQYTESHSDDITELQFHPTRPQILLSGSTDGLVHIYDTTVADEEEALYQTINHGASIHHSNFLSEMDIYALSHDEKFSIYVLVRNPEDGADEPPPLHFHDVRDKFDGEYVVNVTRRPDGSAVMGIGAHSRETLDLVQLKNDPPWTFGSEKVTLPGAHGSEVVRSFCFFDYHNTVFTCGEDGRVKAWR